MFSDGIGKLRERRIAARIPDDASFPALEVSALRESRQVRLGRRWIISSTTHCGESTAPALLTNEIGTCHPGGDD
jgi:hypothetical protein